MTHRIDRRSLALLLATAVLLVTLVACENEQSTPTPQQPLSPLPTQPASPPQPPSPLPSPTKASLLQPEPTLTWRLRA